MGGMRTTKVDLPDDVYAALAEHARVNRRSIAKQLTWVIEEFTLTTPLPVRALPERESTDVTGAA